MSIIDETKIHRSELVEMLWCYRNQLADMNPADIEDEDGNPSGDVRLQVHNGRWSLHTGSSDYDQDHRGYWGASSVSPTADRALVEDIADDLLAECADDFCASKPE